MEKFDYKILDDVPMPPPGRKYGKWVRLAREMKPGQSVLVQNESEYQGLYRAMLRMGYTSRCATKDDGIMIWRVK